MLGNANAAGGPHRSPRLARPGPRRDRPLRRRRGGVPDEQAQVHARLDRRRPVCPRRDPVLDARLHAQGHPVSCSAGCWSSASRSTRSATRSRRSARRSCTPRWPRLVLTLVLGIPLSGRLIRRLRRLSQAALQVAQSGPAVEVPVDRTRDEVGDLSRAFTIMGRRLQQQEEARRAFVATASHELRTPLTSLEGMLELLDEDLGEQRTGSRGRATSCWRAPARSRAVSAGWQPICSISRGSTLRSSCAPSPSSSGS